MRSFAPHIAVLPSPDTEELLAQKGLPGGLLSLLRPYGENIHGKVTIRDSAGSSKSCEDYAVHFGRLKDGLESPRVKEEDEQPDIGDISRYLDQQYPDSSARLRTGGDVEYVEEVMEKHFMYSDLNGTTDVNPRSPNNEAHPEATSPYASPFHLLYLRRILSGMPTSPHETFSHPVACVIAASSRSDDPIEELRQLHASTRSGDDRLPSWITNEYLRYYVLIHDEEHDDAQRSTMLFEQMKRHFGLHCHLLRLRTTQCVPSDDDCVRLPICQWVSAAEELSEIQRRESLDDMDADNGPCIYESDHAAVRTMVRELVTQSVIPLMERLSTTWNDQIVSRRRGISGRFLSLSKKWTPFGSGNRNASSPFGGGSNNPASNYNELSGHYLPDTPEAIMRKLADFAFMLRDYKLAQSVYDLIRTDYNNDKAWKYHAGANEMTAITSLLTGQTPAKSRTAETLDQMMESAVYSYLIRATSPFHALRALAVGVELLYLRGDSALDEAARWASKILELSLVGPIGNALFIERVAACYTERRGTGSKSWGARRRKAALWSVLATEAWLGLDKSAQAEACLGEVVKLYGIGAPEADEQMLTQTQTGLAFTHMDRFLLELRDSVRSRTGADVVEEVGAQMKTASRTSTQEDTTAQDIEAQQSEDIKARQSEDIKCNRRSVVIEPLEGMPLQHAADKPDIKKHRRSMSRISVSSNPGTVSSLAMSTTAKEPVLEADRSKRASLVPPAPASEEYGEGPSDVPEEI